MRQTRPDPAGGPPPRPFPSDAGSAGRASLVGLDVTAASRHLARMRLQGLVGTGRKGQAIFHRPESDEVRAVLAMVHDVFRRPEVAR